MPPRKYKRRSSPPAIAPADVQALARIARTTVDKAIANPAAAAVARGIIEVSEVLVSSYFGLGDYMPGGFIVPQMPAEPRPPAIELERQPDGSYAPRKK